MEEIVDTCVMQETGEGKRWVRFRKTNPPEKGLGFDGGAVDG